MTRAPVDRVDGTELDLVAKGGVVEQRLHQILAIVEGAFDGDVVRVGGVDRGHLPALDLRYPALREKDEDLDPILALAGRERGRASIARRRADDGHALVARPQHPLEQASDQLQGKILEGQGRAVKQLEQPEVLVELLQGGDRRVTEAGIGLPDQLGKRIFDHRSGNEGADHPLGQLGVGEAGEGGDLAVRENRPGLGQVEAAVPSQAG